MVGPERRKDLKNANRLSLFVRVSILCRPVKYMIAAFVIVPATLGFVLFALDGDGDFPLIVPAASAGILVLPGPRHDIPEGAVMASIAQGDSAAPQGARRT